MKTLFQKLLTLTFFSILTISVHASDNDDFALGLISEEKLLMNFANFKTNFQKFTLDGQDEKIVADWPKTLNIDIYFGTWCHDSVREVPKLLKLLKANAGISTSLIALDYQKQDPQALAKTHRIKYTPTIIIYRDATKNEELGRIVERPNKSLVADINKLLLL